MSMDFVEIGKVQKPQGTAGELRVKIEDTFFEDALSARAFFIDIQGNKAPFFTEYLKDNHLTILKLEEVDNREQAAALKSKKLYLRREDLARPPVEAEAESLQFGFLKGYQLQDAGSGELIGRIEEVEEYPQQEMAVVNYQGRPVLIPLHEDLIGMLDEDKQLVQVEIPEGLLDL